MALPANMLPAKDRAYCTATTSSSGSPTSTVVVVQRCKYIGGWFLPNSAGTGTNVSAIDVLAFLAGSPSAATISSGTSVTTTTGTLASPINVATQAVFLNPGDLIVTAGSSCQAGFVTHLVQEF